MNIDVSSDIDELSHKVAEWMIEKIQQELTMNDRFTIVLSGGSTPKKLYQLLALPAYSARIDWKRMHFFWGDERYVPYDDDRNNAKMAFDNLLNHVPANPDHIHIMRTDIGPEEAAIEYENKLHSYFEADGKSFDLVLLGLGDDAHTLSLFPGLPVVNEKTKWVTSFYLDAQQMHRITLTSEIVNRSATIAFLVTGTSKREPVAKVLYGAYDPNRYPAQVIKPVKGDCFWFLDSTAAGGLST